MPVSAPSYASPRHLRRSWQIEVDRSLTGMRSKLRAVRSIRSACLSRLRRARQILFREIGKITAPIFLVVLSKLKQISPAENSGRVHIVENKSHRIIADRMYFQNLHVLFAGNGAAFARRMPLNVRARAADTQVFGGKIGRASCRERVLLGV